MLYRRTMRIYGTKKLYAKGHATAWQVILGGLLVFIGINGVARYTNLLMPAISKPNAVVALGAMAIFAVGAWLMYHGARGKPV
jgi:hypothetical protein